ncbi:MAG: GYD domain-containing protein [Actinobacteria bacterium]|nr:GYD domain-containing protein [Actinomycetota bacterium]
MPKYLIKATYTSEGAKGVAKEGGTSRRDTIAKLAENSGGKLESFYFAFGETDAYRAVILDNSLHTSASNVSTSSSSIALTRSLKTNQPRTTLDRRSGGTVQSSNAPLRVIVRSC